jgi:O-6-methylguanine DNA methyltransferase
MMTAMTKEVDHDPLTAELAGLAADAPGRVFDRIAARWVRVPGPAGDLYVAFTDHGIAYVRSDVVVSGDASFAAEFRGRFGRPLLASSRPPAGLLTALRTGRTGGLRFDLRDVRPFQRDVLLVAARIPPGQLRPYSWIASQIGRPKAVRAVGTALGRNPVPVLIGCHRVVAADGGTGDYVFGPAMKRRLLQAEGVDLDEVDALARGGVRYLASDTTGVVCFPTCPNARRITAAHRHGFRTMADAAGVGYRPCRQCRPVLAPPA